MISHLRCCRARLFSNICTPSYGRTQSLRLRAASSHPQTSTVAERRSCIDSSEHATVLGASGRDSIVICWHPPKPFPYEHTKPIERTEEELREGELPLRVDLQLQFKAGRAGPNRRGNKARPLPELQSMFHTYRMSFYKSFSRMRINETCEPRPINRKGL